MQRINKAFWEMNVVSHVFQRYILSKQVKLMLFNCDIDNEPSDNIACNVEINKISKQFGWKEKMYLYLMPCN